MTTLKSSFRRMIVIVTTSSGDYNSDFFPLTAAKWTTFERVPFLLISSDEVNGFLVSPWDGLGFFCERGNGSDEFWW
jgi:hypothetical protein